MALGKKMNQCGRNQSLACQIVDQLTADVLQAALDAHPGLLGGATNSIPHMAAAAAALIVDFFLSVHSTNPISSSFCLVTWPLCPV